MSSKFTASMNGSSQFAAMNSSGSSLQKHYDGSSARFLFSNSSQHRQDEPNPQAPDSPRKKRKDLPPLFWYMEMGDWERATARAISHPKEVKNRATLRTKSMAEDGTQVTGTKRLALHHACFKLRSAGSAPIPESSKDDPFLAVCKFILLLLEIYPDACQVRESRHGCLPLHLAAFASCYVRPPTQEDEDIPNIKTSNSSASHSTAGGPDRPKVLSSRSCSESTTSTVHSNMTAILMEENFAGAQTQRKKEGIAPPALATPSRGDNGNHNAAPTEEKTKRQTIFISNKREQMAVKVLNAMLDAYPRAIRLDSEGGRLPLHTACAGRATPRCVSLLLRAYPAAARHRNKDGFLPLHLAAHWGVSHPNVVITLLKAYPDATVGRNRWERTPLEEALVMAGENGRPHQAPLVRALRKHPSYWTRPPKGLFQSLDQQCSGTNLVDMDETLASNDETSADDNPKYFNMGHSLLLEDEYDLVPEGEEAELEYDEKGGIISRLRRRRSADGNVTQDLPTLIKNLKWKSVIERLECNPDEASYELNGVMTRGGFTAGSGMTPLHYACERKPPLEVVEALIEANPEAVSQRMMPGGCLPLHIACTWHSSPSVVASLLAADPLTAKGTDELGNRPLHSACFSGADLQIVQDLLSAYSKGVLSRNNQGSQPIEICRRLRHPNRRAVMTALLQKKECIIEKQKHQRSKSSGSMCQVAKKAANLNDRYGEPPSYLSSFEAQNEEVSQAGVEVSYNENEQSQTLLWI